MVALKQWISMSLLAFIITTCLLWCFFALISLIFAFGVQQKGNLFWNDPNQVHSEPLSNLIIIPEVENNFTVRVGILIECPRSSALQLK